MAIATDLPAGEYLLGVGLYDADTLERLPPAGEGLRVGWDEALVGTITVTGK
jgi:hypothetical protein